MGHNFIHSYSLHMHIGKLGFAYKKIVYKIASANTPSIKQKCKDVAVQLLSYYLVVNQQNLFKNKKSGYCSRQFQCSSL